MKIKRLISKLLCLMLVVCLLSALTAHAASPGESGTGTVTVNNIALAYTWGSQYKTNGNTGWGDSHSTDDGSVSLSVSGGTITLSAVASKHSATSTWVGTFEKRAQDSQIWISFQNNDSQGRSLDITYTCSGNVQSPNSTPLSGTIRLEYGESFPDIASAMGFNVIHDVEYTNTSTTGVSGTITITNISVVQEVDLGLYSSTRGSYTYKIGEADATPIAANASVANPEVSMGDSVILTATGTSEYDFYGWMNGSGKLISTSNPCTITVNASMNVYPVFLTKGTATTAPFSVDGTSYMFWHHALEQAKATGKTVVIAENYTLRPTLEDNGLNACVDASVYNQFYNGSGTFTVPSGVTLLIPFDAAHTMYTNCNAYYGETMTTPTAFRTLTMASGTTIMVNGTMNVAGRFAYTNSGGQSGSPTGPLGFVQMNEGSNIIVNGILYAYGYIIGVMDSAMGTYKCGTVTVNSGATVYEVLQMPEYRGGDQSTGMDHNVFPLSQFYVQNIEVPMTLYAGATEKTYGKIYASSMYFDTGITLFGSGGMFELSSGSVTKWYDGTTDRLYIEINGTAEINSIELRLQGLGLSPSVNSKNYVLPINGGFTITLKSGSSLTIPSTQKLLLQPGAQIIIEETATCTVNSALYIYDAAQWGAYSNWGHAGAGDGNCWDTPVIPVSYSPTRTYVRPNVFPRGLFTDSSGNPIYITEDPAIYEAIFGKNTGDLIAEADLAEFLTILPDASILVNGTLSGNVYTTAGGANIYSTGSGQFTQTATADSSVWQLMMGADYSFNSSNGEYYVEAPSNPAQLKNAGGSYVKTADGGAITYNYNSTAGRWECQTHTAGTAATCTTAQTCTVCSAEITPATGHSYGEGVVTTEPTFDTVGIMTYTCSRCGDKYTEEIAMLTAIAEVDGKKYASLTEALEAVRDGGTITLLSTPEEGVEIAQCVTIDTNGIEYTITAADGWAVDGKGNGIYYVKNPALFCVYGTSVKAGDSLDIFFYIQSTDLSGDGYYAKIIRTRSGVEDTDEKIIPYSDWAPSDSYMRFSYSGIAAKEMTDEVYVTIYNSQGQPVSNTFSESVEKYAVRVLNAYSSAEVDTKEAALRTALVDMLNYGAACQDFFNDYNIGDLASARIDDFQDYATGTVAYDKEDLVSGEYFYCPTVTAENSLYLTFYFTGISDSSKDDMKAVVTYVDHYGESVESVISGTKFRKNSDYYGVDVTGLAVADGRQPVTCTVYNADGTVFSRTVCSVECYITIAVGNNTTEDGIVTDDGIVFINLMKFVDSAYNFFHFTTS